MSTPFDAQREHPHTYIVQDRSNQEELTRLQIQDQMITAAMGGVLPEQADPTVFHDVLDIGCGPGGWLIEMAKTYPTVSQMVGVDVSAHIVSYATARAEEQQVADRVTFRAMDALRILEFPDASFDLVNLRFGSGYIRTLDWRNLLRELLRVSRPGGTIRLTESEIVHQCPSAALTQLNTLLLHALYQAGHFFTPENDGVTGELAPMLRQYGLQEVQSCPYEMQYRTGTAEGERFYEDERHAFRTILPFLRKWSRVPDNYDEIYQQALHDMQRPDFMATWRILTAWGKKSALMR